MNTNNVQLPTSWLAHLQFEFEQEYMKKLKKFLIEEKKKMTIFPPSSQIFSALNYTSFEDVKVVILGQDPYHGRGQANGLCFSVCKGVEIPPSLQNIFKELENDMGIAAPNHGDLSSWAKQGVLLLNNVLTVREGQAGSHHERGWEHFTDKIIQILNEKKNNLVFILWGKTAQKKGSLINDQRHLVLISAHPSPLSAYRGFFGSQPFSKTNHYLKHHKLAPIDWRIR